MNIESGVNLSVDRMKSTPQTYAGQGLRQTEAVKQTLTDVTDSVQYSSQTEQLRSQNAGAISYQQQMQDRVSLLQTADAGLAQVEDALGRMGDLAAQSEAGVAKQPDAAQEYLELSAEIDQIIHTTEFKTGRSQPITQPPPPQDMTDRLERLAYRAAMGSATASIEYWTLRKDIRNLAQESLTQDNVLSGEYQEPWLKIDAMDSESLGLAGTGVSSAETAGQATQAVAGAQQQVAQTRADLQATRQNLDSRMERFQQWTDTVSAEVKRVPDMQSASGLSRQIREQITANPADSRQIHANTMPENVLNLIR